ncbi:MAG: aspartate kinase [Pseudobdellovibrio sp.]
MSSELSKTKSNIIVQKYGGATLATPEKIIEVAKRIFELQQSGKKVVVVVSAMGQTTNQLIELAHKVSKRPQLRELDMLLSVGERISMSLLSMALNELGCKAISYTGSQAGIITDDSHVSANIVDVKAFRVDEALAENKVVILAGFQGVSAKTKEITTLGRGGSDTSAVAMAAYLNAERCEILKDVEAVYSADPKIISDAEALRELNYNQLIDMTSWGAKVLHDRSVKLAAEKNVTLFVGHSENNSAHGTLISSKVKDESQKIVAINSFSQVFSLDLKSPESSFDEFQNFLQKNQIGQVQLLLQKNKTSYFTAPSEILKSISALENEKSFKLASSELCSVSVTYAKTCTGSDLEIALQKLNQRAIQPQEHFSEGCSAHFVLKSEGRIDSIKILHSLRNS